MERLIAAMTAPTTLDYASPARRHTCRYRWDGRPAFRATGRHRFADTEKLAATITIRYKVATHQT